jgi:hypothetical protein
LLPALLYSQSTQQLNIYKVSYVQGGPDPTPAEDSAFIAEIADYVRNILFLGGGEISNIEYYGNTKGLGLFTSGNDIGFSDGVILSNGYVLTATTQDGENKTGAQAMPNLDRLGIYYKPGGVDPPPAHYLQDNDMDYIAGYLTSGQPIPDTACDPSIITFKFRPYYN